MKTWFSFLLMFFYFSGVVLLPLGDFSIIPALPKMYAHCQATEDKDMNLFEFLTEHVSGVGQLAGCFEHDDEEDEPSDKPHTPLPFHFQIQLLICSIAKAELPAIKPIEFRKELLPSTIEIYNCDYNRSIFRPPIS